MSLDQVDAQTISDMKAYICAYELDELTDEDVAAGRCIDDFSDEQVLEIVDRSGGWEGPNGWVSTGGGVPDPSFDGRGGDDGHVSMAPHGQWAL